MSTRTEKRTKKKLKRERKVKLIEEQVIKLTQRFKWLSVNSLEQAMNYLKETK